MLLTNWLSHWADHRPDHPAIIFEGSQITYEELHRRVDQTAAWLLSQGASTGDRVVWLGPNQPEFIDLVMACARIGAIFVPLNSRLTVAEHTAQMDDCEPFIAISDPTFESHLTAAAGASAHNVLVRSIDSLASGEAEHFVPSPPAGDTPILIVYTSGTTGAPKGAVHTQDSLFFTILNSVAAQDLTADDIGLGFLPLFHVGGLNIQTLPLLYVGATIIIHRNFDPVEALATIERDRVTVSLFVPATIQAVLGLPEFTTTDLSSIRGVMTGSSIVPTALLQAFVDAGFNPGQVYGSTETGPTSVVLRFEDSDRVGAAGRSALHCETRIVNGELQIAGPHLFDHYWNNPQATAAAFDDHWFRTGDLAHVDDDGWIWIDGRVDEAIISGGENIDPAEVELVLADAPGVVDIAVVAAPSERWGQVPVAFVVGTGGSPTVIDLREHGQDRLAKYKLPVAVHHVDELPRTALGKVQKFELRSRLAPTGPESANDQAT